jgi:hypothetical protein
MAGTAQVTVVNPGADGGASSASTFTITNPGNPQVTLSVFGGVAPGQQNQVDVALSHALSAAVSGQLSLTFSPEASLPHEVDDPAIQFSTGGRTANFVVPAGRTAPYFPSGALMLQTGTVAGKITVTMTSLRSGGKDILPSPRPEQTLLVARQAPSITSVHIVSRTATSFVVEVEGFTTPREITQAIFQFTPKPSQTLPVSETTVSLSEAAQSWFQNPASFEFGGQFVYVKRFSFEGGVSSIATVAVTLSNSLGESNKVSATF